MDAEISGQALGPGAAIRRARSIVGPTLQAAMFVRPRGAFVQMFTYQFGLIGYLMRRRTPKSSLPQTMLLALDHLDLYLFGVALFKAPKEIGHWRLGTYSAVAESMGFNRSLTLQVDGLGDVGLEVSTAGMNRSNLPVIDLVVGLARGGPGSVR